MSIIKIFNFFLLNSWIYLTVRKQNLSKTPSTRIKCNFKKCQKYQIIQIFQKTKKMELCGLT